MKKFLLISLLLLSFTALSSEVELKVVTENWPPFIKKGKEVSGEVTKNIREILSYTDIKYSISIYPWARSLYLATTTPNILIYSIYRTEQREAKFNWICPIYKSIPVHAYKLASNIIDINSLESLRKGVVGVMRGDHSYSYFIQEGFLVGANLDLSSNEEINLRKLVSGRVDVIIQAKESLIYRLDSLGIKDVDMISGMEIGHDKNIGHCMALSLGTNTDIIKKIRKGFEQWKKKQQ